MAPPTVRRVMNTDQLSESAVNMSINVPNVAEKDVPDPRQEKRFVPAQANQRELRQALGCFATGVTVVTITSPDGPFGMTVNSFSSVSLDPPLILWSVDKGSARCGSFKNATRFTVNVLREKQEDLAMAFARDPTAFSHGNWRDGGNGSPVLKGCLATFECAQETHHAGGDHTIIVGRVLQATVNSGAPLLFFGGKFGSVA